ncbi:hypothetical protein P9281_02210 [Caballeronia sp. LP003]|uniref:hypothetical protein n=1 Tax=Caballeronia sp. LP003 TaxID=3038551 RepID=UPI002862C455|nr:hypothetical protein [Caballeronia sp. LP003]MDR5785369.1 hypothetical protein [Caballeronia sp. LP003]
MKTRIAVAILGISAVLAACGGGGSSGSDAPAASSQSATAAGQYAGTVNGRQATVLVLDDGRFYTQYSVTGSRTLIAGVVAGTVTSSAGNLSNGSGTDYNLEGQGANPIALSGTYSAKQALKATVAYANGAQSDFNGSYDSNYETVPTQTAVTGTFKGTSATDIGTRVGTDTVTLTADANGTIAGSGTNCSFTGSIKPHATGNVYDISLNFGSGSGCAYPNTSATGVGVMTGNQIHAFVQTPSKAGVIFLGTK